MPKVIASKPMSTNRRVTIPETAAIHLNIQQGDYVNFVLEDDGSIRLTKAEA